MKVTEIAFCCYAVTDIPRMRKFNKGGSRESATRREGQWIESGFGSYALTTGCWPGMFKPSPDGCMTVLEVENFDDAIAHLKQQGVKFRMEPTECPPCRMAMIFDPDSNTICIHKWKAGHL